MSDKRWFFGRDHIGNYMRRFILATPWFSIRLHSILRSDVERDLHDHPWSFVSFLISGGYDEIRQLAGGFQYGITWPRWSLIRHEAEDLHRILLDKPVWTFVVTGPVRRKWGFQTKQGWVAAADYDRKVQAP